VLSKALSSFGRVGGAIRPAAVGKSQITKRTQIFGGEQILQTIGFQ
jgi:hypothetical protein